MRFARSSIAMEISSCTLADLSNLDALTSATRWEHLKARWYATVPRISSSASSSSTNRCCFGVKGRLRLAALTFAFPVDIMIFSDSVLTPAIAPRNQSGVAVAIVETGVTECKHSLERPAVGLPGSK